MGRLSKSSFYIKVWALCSLPFLVASFLLNPDKVIAGEYGFLPKCLFRLVFGEDCFGCGFARSMSLFAHGRLEESFSYNKMGCVIFMLIVIINVIFVCIPFIKNKELAL